MLLLGGSFWDPSLQPCVAPLLASCLSALAPKSSQRLPKGVPKWVQNGVQIQTLILGPKGGGVYGAGIRGWPPQRV